MNAEIDVRSVLPTLHVPTLVLHRTGDRAFPIGGARYLAEQMNRSAQPQDTAQTTAGAPAPNAHIGAAGKGSDVVDAEYVVVDER